MFLVDSSHTTDQNLRNLIKMISVTGFRGDFSLNKFKLDIKSYYLLCTHISAIYYEIQLINHILVSTV